MKTKHNKKRNTGFIFEALIRELTKSVLAKNIKKASRVRSIIREYFSYGKALKKDLIVIRLYVRLIILMVILLKNWYMKSRENMAV